MVTGRGRAPASPQMQRSGTVMISPGRTTLSGLATKVQLPRLIVLLDVRAR